MCCAGWLSNIRPSLVVKGVGQFIVNVRLYFFLFLRVVRSRIDGRIFSLGTPSIESIIYNKQSKGAVIC